MVYDAENHTLPVSLHLFTPHWSTILYYPSSLLCKCMALAVVTVTSLTPAGAKVTSPDGVRGTREERLLTLQPLLEFLHILLHPSHVHLDGLYGLLHDPHLGAFVPHRGEEVLGLEKEGRIFFI